MSRRVPAPPRSPAYCRRRRAWPASASPSSSPAAMSTARSSRRCWRASAPRPSLRGARQRAAAISRRRECNARGRLLRRAALLAMTGSKLIAALVERLEAFEQIAGQCRVADQEIGALVLDAVARGEERVLPLVQAEIAAPEQDESEEIDLLLGVERAEIRHQLTAPRI